MSGYEAAAVMSALSTGLSMAQQQAQSRHQAAYQRAQAQTQINQIRATQAIEERRRRDRLRRALATQRARFAAQGVGGGGSANAVLGGLAAETDREGAESRQLADMRIGAINDEVAWTRRRNLLAKSQANQRTAFALLERELPKLPLFR